MRTLLLKTTLSLSMVTAALLGLRGTARADQPPGMWLQFSAGDPYGGSDCIGAWNGSMNNGTQLLAVGCNSSNQAKDQAWMMNYDDCKSTQFGDFCSIRNGANYKKCLGTYGGSPNDGAYAVVWDCLGTDHPDQYWQFVSDGNGYYRIISWYGWYVTGSKVVCDWTGTCVDHIYAGDRPTAWGVKQVTP